MRLYSQSALYRNLVNNQNSAYRKARFLGMAFLLLAQGQSIKCLPAAGDFYIRCALTDKDRNFLTEPSTNGYWEFWFGLRKQYYTITKKI